MTARMIGAQLDSSLLLQRSNDLSASVTRSVRVIIRQSLPDPNGRRAGWTSRQSQVDWQGSPTQEGQDRSGPGVINAGYTAPPISGWNALDAAARYMFYAVMLAQPLSACSLNVFA